MSRSAEESVGTAPNEQSIETGSGATEIDGLRLSSTTSMFLSSSPSDSENSERRGSNYNRTMIPISIFNSESYRDQFTRCLHPDNKNILKDFAQFGPLPDNYFIDKYAYRFDVAFSFPSNIRDQVSRIADKLCAIINTKQGKQRLFFDKYHKVELARLDLDLYLQSIYRYEARLIVVFMCDRYKCREWCGLEGRSIRRLLNAHQNNRIMLLTVDGETIDRFSDINGYWNIRDENEDNVVLGIYQCLQALGEPLPSSGALRLSPTTENMISKTIVVSKNIFYSISPWYIVVALLSYILGTITR